MSKDNSINDKFVELMSFISVTENELAEKGIAASHNLIRARIEYILSNAITESYNLVDSARRMLKIGEMKNNGRNN